MAEQPKREGDIYDALVGFKHNQDLSMDSGFWTRSGNQGETMTRSDSELSPRDREAERYYLSKLENYRWPNGVLCPYCGSDHTRPRKDGTLKGRWNCHDCKKSFRVLSGTIFSKNGVPIRKWCDVFTILSGIWWHGDRISEQKMAETVGIHFHTFRKLRKRIQWQQSVKEVYTINDFLAASVSEEVLRAARHTDIVRLTMKGEPQ